MLVLPAGSFTMGSPASEPGRNSDEGPQHTVTIARQFAVDSVEVTVDEYSAFVKATGYDARSKCAVWDGSKWAEMDARSWRNPGFTQTGAHPAVCLNWNDVNAYVAWLSKITGKKYRLLTEAEYEYATRAGTTTVYPWGDAIGQNKANCDGCGSQWDGKQAAPVRSFPPNRFGLCDMLGNVYEWTQDCYHDGYAGAPTDGSAWTSGDCSYRVQRGGSWASIRRISARRTASGAPPTAGTAISASGWLGRFLIFVTLFLKLGDPTNIFAADAHGRFWHYSLQILHRNRMSAFEGIASELDAPDMFKMTICSPNEAATAAAAR